MADNEKGVVAAGFSLLWRRQGILWWVFVVNFVCGALGTIPALLTLSRALSHSLAGQPLSKGFDVGMFVELIRLPNVRLMSNYTTSYIFAFLFLLFMLFASGGILETYRLDRKLATGDFFAASGGYFWRFVRLLLLSLIPFFIVSMIYQGLNKLSDTVGDRAIADQVGIFLFWFAVAVFLLLALVVRLWFDIAQVRTVAQNERGMWRNTWKAFRITFRALPSLFWMYFRISLFAWVTLIVGLVIWAKLPPTATPVTFILLELILLAQLTTRFWQLASAMTWYQRHAEVVPADSVDYTTPHPQEVAEPTPPVEPAPSVEPSLRDPGPELPPADA
ncbi:MAG: hypothetical protein WCC87_19690 [Candidatus Korobacteraceae bacterium]